MRKRNWAVALLPLAFIGCAEKSDQQQVTDAVKAEVRERGQPTFMHCLEVRTRKWQCTVVVHHSPTNRAYCDIDTWGDEPRVACSFRREGRIVIL